MSDTQETNNDEMSHSTDTPVNDNTHVIPDSYVTSNSTTNDRNTTTSNGTSTHDPATSNSALNDNTQSDTLRSTNNTVNGTTSTTTDTTDSNNAVEPTNATQTNTIDSVLHQWTNLSLDHLRNDIDAHTTIIYNETERSQQARKQLADITKQLKSKSDTDKLQSFNTVLKSYQQEINLLTNRCKLTEYEYLKLYKLLLDIPNPLPYLQQYYTQIEYINTCNNKIEQLTQHNSELESELSTIKDQSITIRNLEHDKLQLQQHVEQLQSIEHNNTIVQQQVTDITQLYENKLHTLKQQLTEQTKQYNTTQQQLIQLQQKLDSSHANIDNNNDALYSELNNANNKVIELQQQLTILQQQSNNNTTTTTNTNNNNEQINELESELNKLKQYNTTLTEQNIQLQQKYNQCESTYKQQCEQLQQQYNTIQQQCTQYKQQISTLPTQQQYNELQQHLNLLTELTYTTTTNINNNIDTTQFNATEKVLYNKSNQLESELQQLRQQHEQLQLHHNSIIEQRDTIIKQQTEHLQQISQLQYDLNIANTELNNITNKQSSNTIDTLLNNKSPNTSDTITSSNTTTSTDDNMLNIITQQRNRLRIQISQYETELSKLKQTIEHNNIQLNTLKLDNIKLYEQLQYVKSYSNNNNNNNITTRRNNNDTKIDIAVENKYKQLHDQQHDPFNEFTKQHKLNKLHTLSITERITYTISKFALSRKGTRLFVFIYVCILHILMFIVLYTHTIHSHCGPIEQHTDEQITALSSFTKHTDDHGHV